MRDILFKAKRIDNGEWVEGCLVFNEFCSTAYPQIGYMHTFKSDFYEVNPDTICQYTGLTDKNGNKIWENDILFDEEYFVVRWDEEKAMFVVDVYGSKGCLMEYGFDEDAGGYGVVERNGFDDFCSMSSFEVIGNIFDNPELLEV